MTPELRITVLMENTAREGLVAEHGLSFFLEYRGRCFLLDAGSSGRFADNAQKLGVDLDGVELAALSHGHYDHADGLRAFFALNDRAPVYIRPQAGEAYYSKSGGSPRFVGIHREIWEGFRDRFVPVDGLYPLCPGAWLAPETVRGGPFASREPNLLRKVGEDRFLPDDFSHEQSMVLETGRGLVVLNSCCHGGVVNIEGRAGPVPGTAGLCPAGRPAYAQSWGQCAQLSPGLCPPGGRRAAGAGCGAPVDGALHWSCRLCTAEGGAGGPGGAPHRRNAAGYLRSGISSMFGRTH